MMSLYLELICSTCTVDWYKSLIVLVLFFNYFLKNSNFFFDCEQSVLGPVYTINVFIDQTE